MTKLYIWAGSGTAIGFIVFLVLFNVAMPRNDPERLLWVVFSIMGAIPVAIFAVIFGAIGIIKKDLDVIRREVMRLKRIEEIISDPAASTQFKSGMPPHMPE